jgi:predicted MFS family arabinose efflux permease
LNQISRPLRLQILAILIVRLVFNTMHRMIYPFLSYFDRGLGVDLNTMAYALMARSLTGIFSPLLASVADSRGRKTGMLFGLILFSLGGSLVVFWPVYPVFAASLVLSTAGYLVFIPSLQAYLGDRVLYEQRGLVMAVSEIAWSISAIVGVPLVGFLIARQGWLAPFPLLAVLGLFSFGLLLRILPRDPTVNAEQPKLWANLQRVFTYPPAVAGLVMAALYSTANEIVTVVYGVWVEDKFVLAIASLGAAALGIGLAELGGESLVGLLTDRLGKRRAIAIGIILNCLAALLLLWIGRWLTGALVGLFFFYLTFEFTLVSGIPLMSEILPPVRATLMATHIAIISLGRALGDLLAPRLYANPMLPGIAANAIGAILFNLLALLALRWVVVQTGTPRQTAISKDL